MELATPITVYWDLASDVPERDLFIRICTDVAECRPLMVHLYSPCLQEGCAALAVLEKLQGSRISLSLTVPVAKISKLSESLISSSGIKELLLSSNDPKDLPQGIAALFPLLQKSLGISFKVTRENWRELPKLVAFCRKEGIQRLILPMQRLYNHETPFFITRLEQLELTESLDSMGGIEGISLTIHDPFLWRTFNPGIPFPQGGCQAANTMIAISSGGGVFPCPSLPVKLGIIGEMSLKEIIFSPAKKEFRRRLLAPPADCTDCSEVGECRGGCRGRSYVLHGLEGIDDACR